MLARAILVLGSAAAVSVWIYELWHWGSATWQALPFHQILSWLHLLPKDTYVWAYCATQSAEARMAVEFCPAEISSPALGRIVWLYLGSEAGLVIALTTGALAAVASLFQRVPSSRPVPRRSQAWPEDAPPPVADTPAE